MSLNVYIDNTHTVTVTNMIDASGAAITTFQAGTVRVIDDDGEEVSVVALTGDETSVSAQIPPLAMVEGGRYKMIVQVQADGAIMTGASNFRATYRDISDGVF